MTKNQYLSLESIYINWGQEPKNALYTHTKCADSYTPLPDLKNGFPDPT